MDFEITDKSLSHDQYRAEKGSIAVVVASNNGAWVMFHEGDAIEQQIEALGSKDAEELGIAPEGAGIWIWEGDFDPGSGRYNAYQGDYDDPELLGKFREPTEEEWTAVRAGKTPWNPEDWVIKSEQVGAGV